MASRLRTAIIACALLLLTPAFAEASKTERRVLNEINDYRAAHGVRPVRSSRSLGSSAGRFARHILRTGPHHHRHIGTSRRFRLAGENIAWQPGRRRAAGRVVRMWANSPAHRRVLLNPRFTWGGVGREYGRLRGRRTTTWVLHLGRK